MSSGRCTSETRTTAGDKADDVCWACETQSPLTVRVFSKKEDHQLATLWSEAGLLNFSPDSAANEVLLCPNCSVEFNRAHDPGFVFIPADLQYFIDFELNDKQERRLAAEEGTLLPRLVPTSTMYRDHQLKQGLISDEVVPSGLYQPIFLKTYLVGGLVSPEELGFTNPKPWHGAPLAALRRGILALGSGRICQLDTKTVSQLETLRNLYFQAYYGQRSLESRNKQVQVGSQSRKKRDAGDNGHGGPEKRVVKNALRYPQEYWDLGPQFTTEEIVQRYVARD